MVLVKKIQQLVFFTPSTEGVKFSCRLSSALIKLFTWHGSGASSSWPEPAKWWSVPGQPSGMMETWSTAVCLHSLSPLQPLPHSSVHKPTHGDQSTTAGITISSFPISSPIWTLPSLCSVTAIQQARREEQQRLKSALTLVTQKCNFATLENLITTQGQRKYFKSINEPHS